MSFQAVALRERGPRTNASRSLKRFHLAQRRSTAFLVATINLNHFVFFAAGRAFLPAARA